MNQPIGRQALKTGTFLRKLSIASMKINALFLALSLGLLVVVARAEQSAIQVQNAQQVIANWSVDQHLYVKGDLGLAPKVLSNLEQWLDKNGPHWTVVLMQNASGESFTTMDGIRMKGMDAVEYAIDFQLSSQTEHGTLENSTTGETDGCAFILFLQEKKFSYFGSEAQDRRGLGAAEWIGQLDRGAIHAMRNGGRIVDAVKATVKEINGDLAKQVAQEVAVKERDVRERKRAVEQMKLNLVELRGDITGLAKLAENVRQQFPNATGELTKPPVTEATRQVDAMEEELSVGNVRTLAQQYAQLKTEVAGWHSDYDVNRSFDDLVQSIRRRADALKADPYGSADTQYDQIEATIAEATLARQAGSRDASRQLQSARDTIAAGEKAIRDAADQRDRMAARGRLIRRVVLATVMVCAIFLTILLWIWNRRRAPLQAQALEAFSQREKSVGKEMDRVLELFQRTGEILGSKEKVAQRGYEGETRRLSNAAFESIDDLLILSNEVERVLDAARKMIHPTDLPGKLVNAFSGSRYVQGIHQMSGEPLTFHRDRGLPLVLNQELKKKYGEQIPEEVKMTFEQVYDAFRKRCDDATTTLDRIENSLLNVNDEIQVLQQQIDELETADHDLDELADDDGFFLIPALFDALLPAAQADADRADAVSGTDPVSAARQHIPAGKRKIDDGRFMIKVIHDARRQVFPQLETAKNVLSDMGYQIGWIEQRTLQLSQSANDLIRTAVGKSLDSQRDEFAASVEQLGETADRSIHLAEHLRDVLTPGLEALQQHIVSARQDIGDALQLDPAEVLSETEQDPNEHFRLGTQQRDATRAAISRGDMESAFESQAAVEEHLRQGNRIVEDSRQAIESFARIQEERSADYHKASQSMPDHQQLVHSIRNTYAPSALRFRTADAIQPGGETTAESALEDAQSRLSLADQLLREAAVQFPSGKVLQAMASLADVEAQVQLAQSWFDDIRSHHRAVEQRDRENRVAESDLAKKVVSLRKRIRDPRVTQQTIDDFDVAKDQVTHVREQVSHRDGQCDPFSDAHLLQEADQQLNRIENQIVSDHDAHAEATRAVRGAEAEIQAARQWVRTALTDKIPDSRATTESIEALGEFERQVQQLEDQIQQSHLDWQFVDERASQLHAEIGQTAGKLRNELQLAQKATALLSNAAAQVFQVTRWKGSDGSRVPGSPGANQLETARELLRTGQYQAMMEMATSAITVANHAVNQAHREVERQRRQAARAAQAARRQKRQSTSRSSGSSGRSFRSSTTRFRRSGW